MNIACISRGEIPLASTGRDEGARTDAHIDIALGELDALQRLFKRDQRADLINAAEGTAARERDPHFVILGAGPSLHASRADGP